MKTTRDNNITHRVNKNIQSNKIVANIDYDPYYDIEEERYNDYNTDDPSPIDEDPEYDTDSELYTLYRNTILNRMN